MEHAIPYVLSYLLGAFHGAVLAWVLIGVRDINRRYRRDAADIVGKTIRG